MKIYFYNIDYIWINMVISAAVASAVILLLVPFFRKTIARLKNSQRLLDDVILVSLYTPMISYVVFAALLRIAILFSDEFGVTFSSSTQIHLIGLLVIFVWWLYRFINLTVARLSARNIQPLQMSRSSIHATAYVFKIIVFIAAFFIMMQIMGISMSVFLAFGGIGGLAVALAAQDMLANLFGGLMIYLDRPFMIGDWIYLPEHNLEGDIVKIGWRLTKVATFERRPRYVPNKVFSNSIIENPSRMTHRRIKFTLGLEYDALPKVKETVDRLREALRNHPRVDERQTLVVNFMDYGDYSLNIMIYCMTSAIGFGDFYQAKEEVLLTIYEVVREMGVGIAFPTQQLYLTKNEKAGQDGAEPTGPLEPA